MTSSAAILASWLSTRRSMHASATEQAAIRKRLWRRLATSLSETPAHAEWAGLPLGSFPVRDASEMRCEPSRWNSVGITDDEAMTAAHDAESGGTGIVRDGIVAGLSTGTSGSRGLFLASEAERARYVGQSVACLLPWHAPLSGARVALVLRANSDLYRDVGKGRFAFMHVPLDTPADEMVGMLRGFAPTVLIAPPREIAAMASTADPSIPSLRRLFWGSEPIGVAERTHAESKIGIRPDPIWQATEGFLGSSCPLGVLHVNGGTVEIELEPVAGVDAFRPIVTDMARTTQPVVRMRMDDLVRPLPHPCPCGRGGMALMPIEGRVQDVWRLGTGDLLPGAVDAAFETALGPSSVWTVRGSRDLVEIALADPAQEPAARKVAAALVPSASAVVVPMPETAGPKRRRVQWRNP